MVSSETRGRKERKTALDGTNSFLEIVIGSIENIHVLRRSWIAAIEEEGGIRRPGKIGERIILDRRKWRHGIHDRGPTNDDGSYAALHPRRAPRG